MKAVERIEGGGAFLFQGQVPGDKSVTHRSLLIGALGAGETIVRGPLRSADTRATMGVLRALGIALEDDGRDVRLVGGTLSDPTAPLDCANSGTTARILLGVLAGRGVTATLGGDASLSMRPMGRVVDPLRKMGASISYCQDEGRLPLRVEAAELSGASHTLLVASAQVKSALLLAGLAARGRTVVVCPRPTRDHTERMLEAVGAPIRRLRHPGAGEAWEIRGPAEIRPLRSVDVPGDPSSAAFLWAAAAVTGGEASVRGVLLNPRRTGFLRFLEASGVRVEIRVTAEHPERVGDVRVEGRPGGAVEITPEAVPDLIDELPLCAVVMALAPGRGRVTGAQELRVKESDRIEVMTQGLRALGADMTPTSDGWVIRGGRPLHGASLDGKGDHRTVMALAVAAMAAQGESEVRGAEAADVSFPGFFAILRGGRARSV